MSYKIGIDMDSVLNNLMTTTINKYNELYDANLTIDRFTDYDVYRVLPFDSAKKFKSLWLRQDVWEATQPLKDSQWGIKKLIDMGCDIYIITSTNPRNFYWKTEWLAKNFEGINPKNIFCVHNKGLIKVDFLIDDCLDQILNTTSHRILMNRPWNQRNELFDESHFIYRCQDWHAIIDKVRQIIKEDEE